MRFALLGGGGALAVAVAGTAAVGCSDGGGAADAQVAADADGIDGRADAENLCPGQLTVEARLFDLDGDGALFDVAVSDADEPAVSTTSAPNGRAMLCVTAADAVAIASSGDDLYDRVDRISAAALGRFRAAGEAHPIGMFASGAVAALATDLSVPPPDAVAGWLLVHVLTSDGAPLRGASVAIDPEPDGVFARDGAGGFAPDGQIQDGGAILFTGVEVAALGVVSVVPPGGFAGDCVGGDELITSATAIGGTAFACE